MAMLEKIHAFLKKANAIAWGPPLLFLLLGTGIFLMIQLRALPVRRSGSLHFVQHSAVEARYSGETNRSGSFAVRIADDGTCGGDRDGQYRGGCLRNGAWRTGSTGDG